MFTWRFFAALAAAAVILTLGILLKSAYAEIGEKNLALRQAAASLTAAAEAIAERDALILKVGTTATKQAEAQAIVCQGTDRDILAQGIEIGKAIAVCPAP